MLKPEVNAGIMPEAKSRRSAPVITVGDRKRRRVAVQLTEILYDQKSVRLKGKAAAI
jgi:hypothetical protein